MTLYQFDFLKKSRMPVDKKGLNTRPREPELCPNNHPLWHLYYKRLPSAETIICCKECDKHE